MEESWTKDQDDMKGKELFSVPVPFSFEVINENISIPINNFSNDQIINQALNLHAKGKISEATKYYQYSINKGFADSRIFSNYGIILKNNDKLKEAEILIRKAIDLNPNFAEAHNNLANILITFGKLSLAEKLTRKAIALKPDFAEAYSTLGNIMSDFGNIKEAEVCFLHAIKLKSDFSDAHFNLGVLYKKEGKYQKAIDYFQRLIVIDPNNHMARYHLASSLENEAKFQLHQAFKRANTKKRLDNINRETINYDKKEILIDKNIINILNKLSNSINKLYGLYSLNSGPCGPFANEFYIQWNTRFINQVLIGFIIKPQLLESSHVLVKLPNGMLYDGGFGVHDINNYKEKDTKLTIMNKYDLQLLDKYSWGLIRTYPNKCHKFSLDKISELISLHLNEIYNYIN